MLNQKELEEAYANDNVSISQIADRFGLTWNYVQAHRAAYRKEHGLSTLNRSGKPGF